ncbi:MAG: NlpC/P60 family protein [Eubacteriales bacterium]|nr:NlpC/P60 family protein [Eubacteriales bacterium]
MKDVKQKPRNNAPKVIDKARDIGQSMKKVYSRAKSKADIDNDQYDSPAEYAEAELSEIANDGIEATRKTVRKAGRKIKEKAEKKLEKQLDKRREKLERKREEKLEREMESDSERPQSDSHGRDSRNRRSRGRDRSEKDQNSRRKEHREESKGQKNRSHPKIREASASKKPTESRHAFSESKPHGKHSHTTAKPKAAPKNTAATVRKAPARTVKGASNTVKTIEKSAKVTTKAAAKTAKETAKAAEKAAQAAKVAAERSAQAAKAAAQAAVKIAQVVAKAIVAAAKAIAAAVKELVAAIAAGGWVSVLVIAIVAVVALLVCSAFGLFAHEDTTGCKPMSEIIAEINSEYHERMENDALAIDIGNYDALMISYIGEGDGESPVNNWNDVLAVFAVCCTTDSVDPIQVMELTDVSIDYIRNIFYQMNTYTLTTGGSYDEEEDMYVLTVYINQYCMDYREAADYFQLTDYQREILYEMMKPEYCEYYARLMGINVSGGANVSDILSLLPSGTGGDVCRAAISKLGAPYVLGAKGDDKFDCSGLVCWAINQVDPDLGAHFWARAADQAYYCHIHDMEIEQSELQPGDLVFWQNRQCSGCGRWNEVHHTGIYIGLGMVIEASSSKGRVVIRDLWSTYNYPIYMFARPYS